MTKVNYIILSNKQIMRDERAERGWGTSPWWRLWSAWWLVPLQMERIWCWLLFYAMGLLNFQGTVLFDEQVDSPPWGRGVLVDDAKRRLGIIAPSLRLLKTGY